MVALTRSPRNPDAIVILSQLSRLAMPDFPPDLRPDSRPFLRPAARRPSGSGRQP